MKASKQTSAIVRAQACRSCLAAVFLAMLASGCSSITPPNGVLSETVSAELDKSFNSSVASINRTLASGSDTASPQVAKNFMDSGMGLSDLQCKNYFKNLGLAAQKYAFARKELGLTGGVVAGVQGLTGVSAKIVAITASMFSFGTASAESYADTFLFSPDISGVQELVQNAQSAYRDALPDTSVMSYGDAVRLLGGYRQLCEVQTVRRFINESISSAKPVANADKALANTEQVVTSAERYLLAKEVGEPTLSTDQVTYIYWLVFRAPSDDDLAIIHQGLRGIPLFVAADGTPKTLSATDLQKIKRALSSVLDRSEGPMNAAIARLRARKPDNAVPGRDTHESSEGNGGGAAFPRRSPSSISIRVR